MRILFFAHEGHTHQIEGGISLDSWIHSLGNFHPLFLHFPIALIFMTVIAELFFWRTAQLLFEYTARFLISVAALSTFPTVITGLAYSYQAHYEGIMKDFFWWHRFGGLCTLCIVSGAAILKEMSVRKNDLKKRKLYYLILGILLSIMFFTSFLGGELTFRYPL